MSSDADWLDKALCAAIGGDTWHSKYEPNIEVAKGICKGCPVRQMCLDWALTNNERHGVWGGVNFTGMKTQRRDEIRRNHGMPAIELPDLPEDTGKQRKLPFNEVYVEMRNDLYLNDYIIADRLGVKWSALERKKFRYGFRGVKTEAGRVAS